jgi:hypothetical protein
VPCTRCNFEETGRMDRKSAVQRKHHRPAVIANGFRARASRGVAVLFREFSLNSMELVAYLSTWSQHAAEVGEHRNSGER